MVAEEVKLLRNLVARRFFLRAACSHSLPVKVVCLGLLTVVLLVKFWQPCFVVKLLAVSPKLRVKSWSTWNLCEVGEPKTGGECGGTVKRWSHSNLTSVIRPGGR